jgi:hypothetical protein
MPQAPFFFDRRGGTILGALAHCPQMSQMTTDEASGCPRLIIA